MQTGKQEEYSSDYKDFIERSNYISRDLSWNQFNYRVLHQVKVSSKTILERLKFLAITSSNLDEFLMIRVGSLYNYLDFDRKRIDYCGLREWPFKEKLFSEVQEFVREQHKLYNSELKPLFSKHGFDVVKLSDLDEADSRKIDYYFNHTVFPMLTPMVYDSFHPFPMLMNKILIFGVITKSDEIKDPYRYSFVQVPKNIPKFFEIEKEDKILFVPIEEIIKANIDKLYKNVVIDSISLFRITRNGDFDYDDYDEGEVSFIEEIQKKLKKRKTGRVVRMEVDPEVSKRLLKLLKKKFKIDSDNIFEVNGLFDYSRLWQIVNAPSLSDLIPQGHPPVMPVNATKQINDSMLDFVAKQDLFLHHPYNSMDPVIRLLEEAADDSNVLAIKITIYRLAKDSAIASALLKAAENGKHVSVLFEVKARFDEENNIKQGKRLQRAGCFVVYGISQMKTHTKLLQIVRKQKNNVTTYVHMSSGNYNEDTAKIYSDTSFLTTKKVYGRDISEFFNVITGHSMPNNYKKLITAPGDLRKKLITMIRKEASNAKKGIESGIVLKVNSLEDRALIDELYKASIAGVSIRLIVRGICCIRPGRKGISENIKVKSIVGDFLEHARLFYFHNGGNYKIYGGSADIMVRSFERRIESLFLIEGASRKEALNILDYNLKDKVNTFELQEDGSFVKPDMKGSGFNLHKEFYHVTPEIIENAKMDFNQ